MNYDNVIGILGEIGVDTDDLSERDDGNGGIWVNSYCPLAEWTHEDGTSSSHSFGVLVDDDDVSVYSCFSCKHKETLASLVRSIGGFSGKDLSNLVTKIELLERDHSTPDWDKKRAKRRTKVVKRPPPLDPEKINRYPSVVGIPVARSYLAGRGIKRYAAEYLDLRYSDYHKRIIFPILGNTGDAYGWAGRTILKEKDYPKKYDEKGKLINYPKVYNSFGMKKEFEILGVDKWKEGRPIWINEGLVGHGVLTQQRIHEYFNLCTILGSDLSVHQASIIAQFGEPTVLMLDMDEAGEVGIYGKKMPNGVRSGGAIDMLKDHVKVIVPQYPNDKDDVDEFTHENIKDLYFQFFTKEK